MATQTCISLQEAYAPIRSDLEAVERLFDAELQSDWAFINQQCAVVRSYRGKLLRPALVLLSGKASGSLRHEHVVVAAVIEMVHMATLVHDDVLDGAEHRRRQPTIAATDGNTFAVLLGDYLISHAFHLCSSLPDSHGTRRIGATTNIVCEGEMIQNRREADWQLGEADYFEIIRRKTGALTAVACELGAYYGGSAAKTIQAMSNFGEQAGIAFQIVDDIMDLMGDPQVAGKTLGTDVATGKMTLPLIHALKNNPGELSAMLAQNRDHRAPELVAAIVQRVIDCGGIEYALSVARDRVRMALRQMDCLEPSEARNSLMQLAEFIVDRDF